MQENRLIYEKSPYLLQHAKNPVDWYPWGQEAFEKAVREEKPIFLSIGYSTCHWCHVMERESFEDAEAAALLNHSFVAIKVDREERPDIDAVYMQVCQTMTGSGGWPLTILMTPSQKPFYAATYLPKHSRYGMTGLMELLQEVARLWEEDRESVMLAGDEAAAIAARQEQIESVEADKSILHSCVKLFERSFDRQNGGFGQAPKFPMPHNLLFLLRYAELARNETALRMAETTLTQMARGGLYDQIGGGFSRYATDARWLVPHFEKMLYDNALLATAYLEGFRITRKAFYRRIAERTLEYVLHELTHPEGGFYCGQDADSDGVEGKFYVFDPQEISRVLGNEEGEAFCNAYGIDSAGNFEGKSIPNLLHNPDYSKTYTHFAEACRKLQHYRKDRVSLHKDDKILTSWNALMLIAFTKAWRVLEDRQFLLAAQKAARFLQSRLKTDDGRLLIRWRDGEAAHSGQLDDYAFYAWAMLELYSSDYDPSHLMEAIEAAEQMERFFWDEKGGFYLYASDAEQLISRPKEVYDGALPSGNAAAALVLQRLAKLTGEPRWQELAGRQLAFLAGAAGHYPAGHSLSMLAITNQLFSTGELICCLPEKELPMGLISLLEEKQLTALVKTPENNSSLSEALPILANYPIPEEEAVYYYCREGACSAPVVGLNALKSLLEEKSDAADGKKGYS